MKLLLETTAEYGWHYKGVSSWGADWHKKAVAMAQEQIRHDTSLMVNLEELESYTGSNLKAAANTSGSAAIRELKFKSTFGVNFEKMTESQVKKIFKEHAIVVDISNVHIKPGTDWTQNKKNWKGERKWEAAAVIAYTLRMWGK